MEELLILVEETELLSNDNASYIFRDISIEILAIFLVLVLILYFASLSLSFLKNI